MTFAENFTATPSCQFRAPFFCTPLIALFTLLSARTSLKPSLTHGTLTTNS